MKWKERVFVFSDCSTAGRRFVGPAKLTGARTCNAIGSRAVCAAVPAHGADASSRHVRGASVIGGVRSCIVLVAVVVNSV